MLTGVACIATFGLQVRLTATAACLVLILLAVLLVAEDDDVNAMIVCAFLDGLGLRNQRVPEGRPDLLLMDCHKPVRHGVAATLAIRHSRNGGGACLACPSWP